MKIAEFFLCSRNTIPIWAKDPCRSKNVCGRREADMK